MNTRESPNAKPMVILIVILVIGATVGICYLTVSSKKMAEVEKVAVVTEAKRRTSTTPTVAPVRAVVQMPDCSTPCSIDITEIRDIYTDGEPIWMLPAGWPEKKKIFYSGKGHLVIQGGNIPSGTWQFWSDDPKKVVLIRVFAVR